MLRVMAAVATVLEVPPLTEVRPVLVEVSLGRRAEAAVAAAERLVDANRHEEAVALLEEIPSEAWRPQKLALRHLLVLSWVEMVRGRLERAGELLWQADALARSPHFDASEQAEVLYRQGCLALRGARVAEASSLFTRALETNDRSANPSRTIQAHAHEWRARCHVLRRDWAAARRDVERSLDAADAAGDPQLRAHGLFQASIVAERERQWLLARCYAEEALEVYAAHGNLLSAARTLNNLGCLEFLLGNVETAERRLCEAARFAADAGSDADAAQASSSLAQVYLRTGRPGEARDRALAAEELLEGRTDFLDELGNVQLVLANTFAAEGDREACEAWLDRAEESFAELGSSSHLAAAWTARGDVARAHGDADAAADLYRRAVEALQDFHF
jgi:tetratricopeptide (TPR) repeat protein